jgi:hypothetical protein
MRGSHGVLLGFELGVFGGFLGGFCLGLFGGGFFGFSLGLLGLDVANVIDSLTVKFNARQTSRLACELTHVAQVVAANFAAFGYLYLEYEGAVEQKALFYTNTARKPSYGNAARMAALAVTAYDESLKNLDALFVALANLLVHFDSIATADIYDSTLLKRLLQLFDVFHIRMILLHFTPEIKSTE